MLDNAAMHTEKDNALVLDYLWGDKESISGYPVWEYMCTGCFTRSSIYNQTNRTAVIRL